MGGPPAPIIDINGRPAWLNPYTGNYTTNRAYGLRMQRAYARGVSHAQARGHQENEAELRAQRFRERYGFEETQWRYWRRQYIDWINSHRIEGSNIDVIRPSHITDIIQLWNMGVPEVRQFQNWESWVELRLSSLTESMEDYEAGDDQPGRVNFYTRPAYAPVEFWWYH